MLWRRRAGKDANGRPRKFPALVQEGLVLGDIVEIEEWNEYGELKQHVKIYYDEYTIPDINHKHPPLRMKKPNMMQRASGVAGSIVGKKLVPKTDSTPPSSNLGTPAPPNPPPAPDLSKAGALDLNKSATAPAAPDKGKEVEKPKPAEKEKKEETLPMRSVADEAAQKAKELRLKSLREKVHGKGAGDKKPEEKKDAATKEDKELAVATPKKDAVGTSTPGLQSPTSGKWKTDSSTPVEDIQSPRSSTWKPAVATAPGKEIKKVEDKEAIKEQPKKEAEPAKKDDDDDDDSDEDDSEEESSEEESEEEEEDDDDDDDEDDSDEDSDEDEKKPATKPEAAKASAAATATAEKK